jgi:protein phosphatase
MKTKNIKLSPPLAFNEIGRQASQDDSVYPPVGTATPNGRFFLVCDGLGGNARGDVASGTVCHSFASFLEGRDLTGFDQALFDAALSYAKQMLDRAGGGDGDPKRMATTLTFLCVHRGGAMLAHIGDSRVYHVRPSRASREGAVVLYRTSDHSHVNELVRAGVITEAEAADHPKKNIVTRALQPNQQAGGDADCHWTDDVAPGDYFFLCTDGVLESIDDALLCQILGGAGSDESKLETIRLTCQKGSEDNFSAYLVPIAKAKGLAKYQPLRVALVAIAAIAVALTCAFAAYRYCYATHEAKGAGKKAVGASSAGKTSRSKGQGKAEEPKKPAGPTGTTSQPPVKQEGLPAHPGISASNADAVQTVPPDNPDAAAKDKPKEGDKK